VSRENREYIVGNYWLGKRRDGKSRFYQIATYKPGSRQVVYRSTKCESIEDAKGVIHSFVDRQRSREFQPVDQAELVPALFAYWDERGKKAEAAYAIATSLRNFIGFLMQDEAGVHVTIAKSDRALFRRYGEWRMEPHTYAVPWAGKVIKHSSRGVKGETLATNLAHIRAALNYQLEEGRIAFAPKIHAVDKRLRSTPRELLYTIEEMGAIMMVAAYTPDLFRWLALQLATCCRPVAALRMDPRVQYDAASGLIDLHPKDKARTRKRNPVVPVIDEMRPILAQWAKDGSIVVRSRKTQWRQVRRLLGLPAAAEAKTIRYSVATEMRRLGVPAFQIESMLGHDAIKGVSARYAKYDPAYLKEARDALSNIFQRVAQAAFEWGAVHFLSKTGNGRVIVVDRNDAKAQDLSPWNGGAAYRTRTCDPRITNARKRHRKANPSPRTREQDGDS
jgi:hypothetical protein